MSQQWTPYGLVPFRMDEASNRPMFMMVPPNQMRSGQQIFVMMDEATRPHSVAFGSPPQPHSPMYPLMAFNPWQQQPDVTSRTALQCQDGLQPRPDVITSSQSLHQQPPPTEQPCYANQCHEQPTYANEMEQQPSYMNTDEVQQLPIRLQRGASLPPKLKSSAAEWTPKPPPRSKRGSKMGSRSSLTSGFDEQIDAAELSAKLNKLAEEDQAQPQGGVGPKRPPRKKRDWNRRKSLIGGDLQSIAEDLPEASAVLTVPQPTGSCLNLSASSPVVPMPKGDDDVLITNDTRPVIPMPTGTPTMTENVKEEVVIPSIPQPSGEGSSMLSCLSTDDLDFAIGSTSSRPVSQVANFTVTLPLPSSKRKQQQDRCLDPIRSRTTSMQSIRDEIIDGIQKMSTNVDFLKRGVAKIYEDLMPTYALPKKAQDHARPMDGITGKPAKVENPYETVSVCGTNEAVVEQVPDTILDLEKSNSASSAITEAKIRDQMDKAFHATFFGIESNTNEEEEEDIEEEDDNDEEALEDEGEKTPTYPDIPIEAETEATQCEEKLKQEDTITPNVKALPKSPSPSDEDDSTTEEVGSDTETLDVSLDMDGHSVASAKEDEIPDGDGYHELMTKAVGTTWEEVDLDTNGLPPPLALHANIRTLKLDLLSSIFQGLYPTEQDCMLVRKFLSCPASLEEKYNMIRLSDLLKRNKRSGIELEDIAEAMSQLAKIGSELLRPEEERDPLWRSIPVAKEIMVTKGIATRAPWESIQGGSEILESLGYTEYTGFALQYPRSVVPEFFADHIGNLTVELVLATVEISTLLIRVPPTLETLAFLQEAEAFPGNDPEVYYPDVPMLAPGNTDIKEEQGIEPTSEVSLNHITRDLRAASLPATVEAFSDSNKVAGSNTITSTRRHANESDYEEIGPPPALGLRHHPTASEAASSSGIMGRSEGEAACDLCGTASAIVRCASCSEQIFCLACDDMYHRHPKRMPHVRKALNTIRPPLPPKGDVAAPVAPPRKNPPARKGSAPESPVAVSRQMTRSMTLPRKVGLNNSMAGRPLPPPPPPAPAEIISHPPPALPAKNATTGPFQPRPAYPNEASLRRKESTSSQPPMHLSYPSNPMMSQPEIPMPGYPVHANGVIPNRAVMMQQPHMYPGGYVDQMNCYPGPGSMVEPQPWANSPYLEEMQFGPHQQQQRHPSHHQMMGEDHGGRRMPPNQRSRFFKLNKSSSLHDIAHEEANARMRDANGISWMDEPWNATQSTMNQPTINVQELLDQQRNFRRASSTKSLHQNIDDPWSSNGQVWDQHINPAAMVNPMLFGMRPQMANGLNRSMHELRLGQPSASVRGTSPSNSHKSKKSNRSERFHSRAFKNNKRSGSSNVNGHEMQKQSSSSRPHSRSNSQQPKSSRHYRGSSRSHRKSFSSEDEVNDDDSEGEMEEEMMARRYDLEDEDDDEDFFTGESDNDFVSISSGSNSKRAPRKSWTCEHCTYVNNPGISVCVMCCRTSKQSRGEEQERANSRIGGSRSQAATKKKKSSSSRYETSEDEDVSERDRKNGLRRSASRTSGNDSKTNSLKRRSNKNRKKHAKSPVPEYNVSDLEQDAINEYYAVRHNHKRSNAESESSSETSSVRNMRKPNFDAPAPAKGILKKSNSNPQLTKLEMESKVDKPKGHHHHGPPGKVVDIKKYLAQTRNNPAINDFSGDIWQQEKANWIRASRASPAKSYLSDDADSNTSTANNIGRPVASASIKRSVSGHSLGDLEYLQQQYDQQQKQSSRRTSEAGVAGGKKNFRTKRFSRNIERDPALRRAHSLHMDRRSLEDDGFIETHRGTIRSSSAKNSSGSSGAEDGTLHFTATVQGHQEESEISGSYLSRKEFGLSEGGQQAFGDSGYVSHGSGGNGYPKIQLPAQAPIESFTMSVDRGYLGRAPGDRNPNLCRSMDDLTFQKTKGLELVRLLREAEQNGFTAEDVQVALNHCGDSNPVGWLKENWDNMMETVVTLASNVGHEAEENTIGTLSKPEAKEALRKHKGNIWAAVTECVEQRQMKYDQLCGKGNFTREDIVTVLTANQGNVEAAFQELNKVQLKPFLMRIWGQGETGEVTSGQAVLQSPDSPIIVASPSTDDRAASTNEVAAEAKNNNILGEHHHNESKRNAATGGVAVNIAEAREKYKFDREVRKLLAEGKIPTYEKGELVVQLKEQDVAEEEALIAAQNCSDLYAATKFLRQECELCMNVMNVTEISVMPSCDHRCCRDCATKHFTILVKDKNICEATCPFCQEPKGLADDDDLAANYFARLDTLLKPIVDQDVHDLFQRKLRDRTLMKDPNFKWCYKCSSGFIADPRNKKLVCPDCRAMSCAKCLLPWESTHEGLSCEDFAAWKEDNDPDNQAKGVEKHLQEHGIQCPNCKFRYTLTKGGCMHFTCTQCKYEFCIGCERPFKMGVKCGKGPACAKMGLHAHHPRHCLFYLRDKEPGDLQRLLKTNSIDYSTEMPEDLKGQLIARCRVQVQKESSDGLVDGLCNEIAPQSYAGYCKIHYTEYLCGLVFKNNVDPVSLLDLGELKQVFARANHFMPKQRPGEYEFQYKKRLAQLVATEVPLENA